MTPRQDLLDHAVNLFPAPEGSVADVQRDVARRHRNRRLGAAAVVIGLWVVIGVAASASRTDDVVPIQSPTPAPSPTVAPQAVPARGWPATSGNPAGVYSWDGSDCEGEFCSFGWMHNASHGGSGAISIVVDGLDDHIKPHSGERVTVFGYEGSYRRYAGNLYPTGPGASCERWMVDIQGTTVTIDLCARPGAPAEEIAEAREIIESMRVETFNRTYWRLLFTLTTNTWDSG